MLVTATRAPMSHLATTAARLGTFLGTALNSVMEDTVVVVAVVEAAVAAPACLATIATRADTWPETVQMGPNLAIRVERVAISAEIVTRNHVSWNCSSFHLHLD